MLPNHAPLNVAERFHMLEALFPGRIDLGIGPKTAWTAMVSARRAFNSCSIISCRLRPKWAPTSGALGGRDRGRLFRGKEQSAGYHDCFEGAR
jgi:hypothetical protein